MKPSGPWAPAWSALGARGSIDVHSRSADIRFRAVGTLVLVGVSALLLAMLARVAQLQIAPERRLVEHMADHSGRLVESAPRGDLRDRRGRIIATSSFGWRVFVDPARFADPLGAAIAQLAGAMDMDADVVGERIVERMARNEQRRKDGRSLIRYVSIGSPLKEAQVRAVRQLRAPGVYLERTPVRRLVEGEALASLVGLVGADDAGLVGAERTYQRMLKPTAGSLRYTRDALGRTLWVEVGSYQPGRRGQDIWLSVDLAIQEIAIDELERGVRDADAAGGRVVALDPETGEILAMADVVRDIPGVVTFDPALIDPETGRGPRFVALTPDPNRRDRPALRRNRCVEDVYEPGSTFKPFMWSAVTERGLLGPGDIIDTHNGKWRTPYGRLLADVGSHEKLTWRNVLVDSSNIGMAQGVARLTAAQMRQAVVKLGFGEPTGVGLPGEASGIVTSLKNWSVYTQTSVAMGYEVAVTPVQMVRAFSAFARDGALAGTTPSLRLTAAGDDDGNIGIVHRVFPARVALLARSAMRDVAKKMDDRMVKIGRYQSEPRYTMFGKSGTANIPRPDGKGYIEGQYISSFIVGAPMDNPRLVVLVVIDDPGPELVARRRHYGSYVAGPVTRRIVERTLDYLGVKEDRAER